MSRVESSGKPKGRNVSLNHTSQSIHSADKLEVKGGEQMLHSAKLCVQSVKHKCSTDETILFGPSNNIVSHAKHKCLTRQTIVFQR